MSSFAQTRVLIVFLVTIFLAGGTVTPGFSHESDVGQVVLGDSIESGFGSSIPADAFVPLVHEYLESTYGPDVDEHNLAVPGATVLEINRNQLASAIAEIQNHDSVVVSWGGGGNDLLDFIESPQAVTCLRGNVSCLNRLDALLNKVEHIGDRALKFLRSAAGPDSTILVRTQYNPLLRDICGGPSHPLAHLANVVLEGGADPFLVRGLNDRIRDLAAKHGARVAEIFLPFYLYPDTLISDDCVHPSDAGHKVIGDAFILPF